LVPVISMVTGALARGAAKSRPERYWELSAREIEVTPPVKPSLTRYRGGQPGLAEVEHLQAEGRKGIDEFADGAVVQAAMAPDLEDAPAGGGHGG